MILALT